MPNDTPEGIGGSLSLAEAAAAYATPAKKRKPQRPIRIRAANGG
jgi:hypothetical protein